MYNERITGELYWELLIEFKEILSDLIGEAILLLILLFIVSSLLLLTYHKRFLNPPPFKNTFRNVSNFRYFIKFVIGLILITIIYWAIDSHISNIPDPSVPYIFFILIITIIFGFKPAFVVSILSAGLIEYFLFEPRYQLTNNFSTLLTNLGLLLSLIIGAKIRNYELKLVKGSDELKTLLKARDEFASIAAHDLKNPLTTIRLYAEMLDKKFAHKGASKALLASTENIRSETDKVLEMIDRLLDFSKIQQKKFKLKPERVDLIGFCKNKVKTLTLQYPNFRFLCKTGIKKAFVLADKISLDRIVANLVTNAIKHSPLGSTILISIKKLNGSFELQLKDEGSGIETKNLVKIFEPFFQSDRQDSGLGLGLYISKHLVEMQKGQIRVESEKGKGTSFFISLPQYRKRIIKTSSLGLYSF